MSAVSVIIPVYNVENYIDKCINSVCSQTYKDFSLILIDDGSSDGSLQKCIEWQKKDSRIIVVTKKNIGLGETRNLGVRMAETEYITFLDADDWWSEDYLSLMMQGTENNRNDIVLCDMNYVCLQEDGSFYSSVSKLRFSFGKLNLFDEWNLINRTRTFACSKLFRRSLFLKFNIKQPAHAFEDVATVPYLIARANNIFYVQKAMYFYLRNREGSIVNNFTSLPSLLDSLSELYQKFYDDNLLKKYQDQLRQLFWGQFCFINRSIKGKFINIPMQKREEIKIKSINTIEKYFPELKEMYSMMFYTDVQAVKEALNHIVLNENQISKYLGDTVNVIVTNEDSNLSNIKDKRIIFVVLPNEKTALNDKETASWNLADEIFYKLWK